MLQDFTARPSHNYGSPVVPKFRQSYNSAQQPLRITINCQSRPSHHLLQSERIPRTAERLQPQHRPLRRLQHQYKENVSPLLMSEKALGKAGQDYPSLSKRPITSYFMPGLPIDQQAHQAQNPSHTPRMVSPFVLEQRVIENACQKMCESIIMCSGPEQPSLQSRPKVSVDSFERLRFLGQGKFGQVHLVMQHKDSGFICALKIIDKQVVRQEKVEGQIAKELRIHSRLKSLNIIDFYGFFHDEANFYILLEYATEGSVFSRLKGKTRLPEHEVLPIAKGLCEGLRYLHRMGFVHRDIKPENIVMQFGVPKICDFGWATDCDDIHLCKSYCGTPLYISPEMIRRQFYGCSVDIWAAGLVVYELLVGRVPFSIWSENDMNLILTKAVEFPTYVDRSQKCQSFIRKCLEKHSLNRIEISQALRHPFLLVQTWPDLQYQFHQQANRVIKGE